MARFRMKKQPNKLHQFEEYLVLEALQVSAQCLFLRHILKLNARQDCSTWLYCTASTSSRVLRTWQTSVAWNSLSIFQIESKYTLPAALHIQNFRKTFMLSKSHTGCWIKPELKGTLWALGIIFILDSTKEQVQPIHREAKTTFFAHQVNFYPWYSAALKCL